MVCENHLRSDSEVTSHIAKPVHQKNLDAAEYVEKYKDEKILKVNKGYFCTFCGLLLSTVTKAGFHVKEKQHTRNKAVQLIKRDGCYVVAYDSLLIDYDVWSGFTGNACAVCNVDVTNRNLHKSDFTHILNLVQSCVEFGDLQQIYRKVDESSFHCITCNEIYPYHDLDNHFKEAVHSMRLTKCKDAFLNYKSEGTNGDQINKNAKFENVVVETKSINSSYEENKLFILDSIPIYEKNEVDINIENETAFCKKCFENVDFDPVSISNHIKKHESSIEEFNKQTNGKILPIASAASNKQAIDGKKVDDDEMPTVSDPLVFAKENMLTYDAASNNAYCRVCDVRLPASLASMKEHVSGSVHRKLSANKLKESKFKSKKQAPYRKTPMKDFVEELCTIRHFNGHERIVNDQYCISQYSFLLITNNGQSLRCQACEVNLTPYQVDTHQESFGHNEAMGEVSVITSLDRTEFVREVRTGIFHCGYCNLVIAPWDDLQNHLKSREHKNVKEYFLKRLTIVEPELRQLRVRRFLDQTRARIFGFPFGL
ncbi:hypothetical protein evm_011294 [Chilo suppressalis]|nr:hypothetical protein evm_011294 [Chilo suppressalis]